MRIFAEQRDFEAFEQKVTPDLFYLRSSFASVAMPDSNEKLYALYRSTVARIEALGDRDSIIAEIGSPEKVLPVGDFFVTDPTDLTVTYCDLVELHLVDEFVVRIGYINNVAKKIRGMPQIHWRDLE